MANIQYDLLEYYEEGDVPYETGRSLGNGAFATVYRAKEVSSSIYAYAAKVFGLPNDDRQRESQKAKIKQEAKLISKAQHQHTVSLVATYIFDDMVYIIMQPLADQNLERYLYNTIRHRNETERRRLQNWFGCLVSGLAYLHRQDIRHRDIKPRNILVLGDRILLTDFGISNDNPGITLPGTTSVGGTLEFKPPEWEKNGSTWIRPGRSGDVYSLGAVFLDMLLVYSGQNLDMLRDERGVHLPFRDNADRWISNLNNASVPDVFWYSTILILCQMMLREDPKARPHADELELCWSYQPYEVVPPTSCDCHAGELIRAEDAHEVLKIAAIHNHRLVTDLMLQKGLQ